LHIDLFSLDIDIWKWNWFFVYRIKVFPPSEKDVTYAQSILLAAEGNLSPRFKVGDYIHNGYVRMKILKVSDRKGYAFFVRCEPQQSDSKGAQKMRGEVFHISDKVVDLDCRKVN
jgi:hypothetical protein